MKITFKSTLGILGTSLAISSFALFNPGYNYQIQNNTARPRALVDSTNHQLFAPGAQVELIAKQFKFTEGPIADKQGNVFFTDQPNDKIWKYDTDGKLSIFMEKTGRSNGMYFDKKGNLLTCADENNQIWSISPDKKVTVVLKDLSGKKLNGPNDLWVHPKNGIIYFTDPFYPRDYWTHKTPELAKQNVYYLLPGKSTPMVADENLEQPNGIIGSPDGKTLFVADIKANKTYKYQIAPDGKLTNRQLFVEQGSDGMTIDSQGNVYLTGKGVTVYSPAGVKLVNIPVPAGWTANVTFGGKDRKMLFITALEGVYKLPMLVKGA